MYAEQHVADALGLPRQQLRDARELLKERRDFLDQNGRIELTGHGLARILMMLRCRIDIRDVIEAVEVVQEREAAGQDAQGGPRAAAPLSSQRFTR